MKMYLRVILWAVFVLANLYAVKFAFEGMTYNSDLTFFGGFVGLILLLLTDGLILIRAFKKYLPKGDL